MKQSYIYILKCSDKTYYTGVTSNIEQRLFQQEIGFYQTCYTYARRPIELVFFCEFTDINLAIEKEKKLKNGSKPKRKHLLMANMIYYPI